MSLDFEGIIKMKTKEKSWAWGMAGRRIYKVVSNPEEGTVKVYDPNGKLVEEHKGLSSEGVNVVEENFLKITSTKMGTDKEGRFKRIDESKMEETENYIR